MTKTAGIQQPRPFSTFVGVRLTESLAARLSIAASTTDVSASEIVREALVKFLSPRERTR